MKEVHSGEKDTNQGTVERPGAVPPCLDRAPGQCRGCFGWDHMMEAAKEGGCWTGTPVRCDITGLTVRPSKKGEAA